MNLILNNSRMLFPGLGEILPGDSIELSTKDRSTIRLLLYQFESKNLNFVGLF